MQERTLDRIPRWDERNENYPIRELIGSPPLKRKIWWLPERLNQGAEGACVGFGWTHELLARPFRTKGVDPRAVYHRAQQIDEWPGEAYSGTSVLAGAKVIQELGHLVEYRWALNVDDVLTSIAHHGPVVIGVNWHREMFNTDSDGYIHPRGDVMGGHCVCLYGVVRHRGTWVVIGRNSWGWKWGRLGNFKMTTDSLAFLMENQGEVCVPVVRN